MGLFLASDCGSRGGVRKQLWWCSPSCGFYQFFVSLHQVVGAGVGEAGEASYCRSLP